MIEENKETIEPTINQSLFVNPTLINQRHIALEQNFSNNENSRTLKLIIQAILRKDLSKITKKIKDGLNMLENHTNKYYLNQNCKEIKKSLPNLSLDSRNNNNNFFYLKKNKTNIYINTISNSRSVYYKKFSPEEQMRNILKEKELNQMAAEFCRKNMMKQIKMRKEKEHRLKSQRDKDILKINIENEIQELEDEEKVALKKIDILKRFEQAKRLREDSRNQFKQLLMQSLNNTPYHHKRNMKSVKNKNSHCFNINSNFNQERSIKALEIFQTQNSMNGFHDDEKIPEKKETRNLLLLSKIYGHSQAYENYKYIRSQDREHKKIMVKEKESFRKLLISKFQTKIIQKVLKDDKELKAKQLQNKENLLIRKEKMKVYADVIKEAFKPKIDERKVKELQDSKRKLENPRLGIRNGFSEFTRNKINYLFVSKRNSIRKNHKTLIKLIPTVKEERDNLVQGNTCEKNQLDKCILSKVQTTKNASRSLNRQNPLRQIEDLTSRLNHSILNQRISESINKERIKLDSTSQKSTRSRKISLNKILLPNWKKDIENHKLTLKEKLDRVAQKAMFIEYNAQKREEYVNFQRINTHIEKSDLINNMYVDAIKAKLSIFDEFHKQ